MIQSRITIGMFAKPRTTAAESATPIHANAASTLPDAGLPRDWLLALQQSAAAALQAEMRNPTATAGRYSVV